MLDLQSSPDTTIETTIEAQLREYLTTSMGVVDLPDDDAALAQYGFVASAQLIELVDFIEERFGVVLRPIDVLPERLATIGTIAETVRSRKGQP